jgi:hypothetical protein
MIYLLIKKERKGDDETAIDSCDKMTMDWTMNGCVIKRMLHCGWRCNLQEKLFNCYGIYGKEESDYKLGLAGLILTFAALPLFVPRLTPAF